MDDSKPSKIEKQYPDNEVINMKDDSAESYSSSLDVSKLTLLFLL